MDIGCHICADLMRSCIIMWADVMFLLVLCFIVLKMLFVSDLEITAISALWAFVSGFPICFHYTFVAQNDVYVDLSPLWPVGHLL